MTKIYRIVIFLCLMIFILSSILVGSMYANFRLGYRDIVEETAINHNIAKSLVFAIIKAESGFDKDAVSYKGAIGLMQILPTTTMWLIMDTAYINRDNLSENTKNIEELTLNDDIVAYLKHARNNIEIGVAYLEYLTIRYKNNIIKVLSAYNAGTSRVDEWIDRKSSQIDTISGDFTIDDIQYKETQNYVRKVLKYQNTYEKLYNLE